MDRSSQQRQNAFFQIYDKNKWGKTGSKSGKGSIPESTGLYREYLAKIIQEYDIPSICDIGCGDVAFMKLVLEDFPEVKYYGVDVASNIIQENQQKLGHLPNVSFGHHDIVSSPITHVHAQLVTFKEVVLHLTFSEIKAALTNISAMRPSFVLLTCHTGKNVKELKVTKQGRIVNLLDPEFNLRKPDFAFEWFKMCQVLFYDTRKIGIFSK